MSRDPNNLRRVCVHPVHPSELLALRVAVLGLLITLVAVLHQFAFAPKTLRAAVAKGER